MYNLGDFATGSTVRGMWNSNAVAGESITRATNGSLRIYKNNSTTERSSSAGITDTEDFDALTGVHHFNVDLSDNTDAGFYAAGNDYFIVLQGATIDGKSINAFLAMFSIENRNNKVDAVKISGDSAAADNLEAAADGTGYNLGGGSIVAASVTADVVHSGTAQAGGTSSVTLAAGASSTDDGYNYQRVDITSGTGAGQSAIITDYNGTTKVATVDHAWQVQPDNTSVYRVVYSRVPRDVSKVTGDVEGKLLGTTSGGGTISGAGAWVYDHTGAAISGGGGGLDAAGVRSAVGLATANLDTQLSGISSKTANLPTDPADASDVALAFISLNSKVDTIDDFLDTEIAAIKAKTDNLPSDPADASDIAAAFLKVRKYLQLIARKDAAIATDNATELGELNANAGSGAGSFDNTTDSVEALHDLGITASAIAELTGDPGATPTITQAIMLMYMEARNQFTIDKSPALRKIRNNAGTVILQQTLDDDGTTFTRGKVAAP